MSILLSYQCETGPASRSPLRSSRCLCPGPGPGPGPGPAGRGSQLGRNESRLTKRIRGNQPRGAGLEPTTSSRGARSQSHLCTQFKATGKSVRTCTAVCGIYSVTEPTAESRDQAWSLSTRDASELIPELYCPYLVHSLTVYQFGSARIDCASSWIKAFLIYY